MGETHDEAGRSGAAEQVYLGLPVCIARRTSAPRVRCYGGGHTQGRYRRAATVAFAPAPPPQRERKQLPYAQQYELKGGRGPGTCAEPIAHAYHRRPRGLHAGFSSVSGGLYWNGLGWGGDGVAEAVMMYCTMCDR